MRVTLKILIIIKPDQTSVIHHHHHHHQTMTKIIMMAFRQIPHMTKSHHGGNMSLIGEVGICHRHIPTIDNYDDDW